MAQISMGLQLFVLSKALVANKYRAQIIPTAKIVPSAKSGLCDCKGKDVGYHNDTLLGGVIYNMEKTDANDGNHGLSMASTIIQGGWASPESLYQGAFDCAASGLSGQGLVNLNADNKLDLSCLSQLSECFVTGGQKNPPCAAPLVNGNCPIGVC